MPEQDSDSELRKRLRGYTEEPDESVWDHVSGNLPGEDGMMKQRLGLYEEQPDASVWSAVENSLYGTRSWYRLELTSHVAALLALLLLIYPLSSDFSVVNQPIDKSEKQSASEILNKNTTQDSIHGEGKLLADTVTTSFGRSTTNKSVTTQLNVPTKSNEGIDRVKIPVVISDLNRLPRQQTIDELSKVASSQLPAGQDSNTAPSHKRANEAAPGVDERKDSIVAMTPLKEEKKENFAEESRDEKKDKNKNGSSLYFLVMPTLGYQQITPVKDDGIIIESYEKLSSFSPKRLGIRAEVGWEKKLSSKFSFTIGAVYFQRKQTFVYQFSDTMHGEVRPVEGQPFTYELKPTTKEGSYEYEVKNVGVQAGLNYVLGTGRFIQRIGLAAELHKNLSGNGIYLFGDTYYRISYPVGKRLDLMAQPTLNYALRLTDQLNAPFYVKPYGLGLSVGVVFKIGSIPNKP